MSEEMQHDAHTHGMDEYKRELEDEISCSFRNMKKLAEIEPDELCEDDTQDEKVEYMLEKVMKYGSRCDLVHALRYFTDYTHAVNELHHAK